MNVYTTEHQWADYMGMLYLQSLTPKLRSALLCNDFNLIFSPGSSPSQPGLRLTAICVIRYLCFIVTAARVIKFYRMTGVPYRTLRYILRHFYVT